MTSPAQRRRWADVRKQELIDHPDVFAAYAAFVRADEAAKQAYRDRPMITIEDVSDIPLFATEDEEHEYWGMHDVSDEIMAQAEPFSDEELALMQRVRDRRGAQPAARDQIAHPRDVP